MNLEDLYFAVQVRHGLTTHMRLETLRAKTLHSLEPTSETLPTLPAGPDTEKELPTCGK
jgi:hypothetical protein